MTDRARFATFDAVKDAYIDFARQQIKNDNSSRDRRSVSAVQGRGGQNPAAPEAQTINPSIDPAFPPRSK